MSGPGPRCGPGPDVYGARPLMAQTREHLEELDRALDRLERGAYGRCEGCGTPIPPERLEIRPATTTCVACAQPVPHRSPRPA